jgi:hypothetical protein
MENDKKVGLKIKSIGSINKNFIRFYLNLSVMWMCLCCGREQAENISPPNQTEKGSWTIYTPYKWTHDGNPVSSDWCTVYSDGASTEVKIKAGIFFDSKFEEVLAEFEFDRENEFLLPPENEKINLYLNRYHDEAFAAAFWGTVFITIRQDDLDTTRYNYLFKHELTHEFEYLIEGTPELGTDVWFREGIAIYVGSNAGWDHIRTVNDLDTWISSNASHPDMGNPISIHCWEDFPDGSDITGYYTVFYAVMEYILHPSGLGRTKADILQVFFDIRNGDNFSETFLETFESTIPDFEAGIYDNLKQYLERTTESSR